MSPGGLSYEEADKKKPFVCFGSFQDYLGRNPSTGGIKTKNEWVHTTHWDCVILDEYHYGAWRENAKDLFEAEDEKEVEFGEGEGIEDFDEDIMPITTDAYLYLSGTPFRAIASGEFIEEQIYNWTYSDEQRAKQDWKGPRQPLRPAAAHGAADLPTARRNPGHRDAGRVQRVRPERLLLRRGPRRRGERSSTRTKFRSGWT